MPVPSLEQRIDECKTAGLPIGGRLCNICAGLVFSAKQTNGYRKIWGLEPLPDEVFPSLDQTKPMGNLPPIVQRPIQRKAAKEPRRVRQPIKKLPRIRKTPQHRKGCGDCGGKSQTKKPNGYGPGSQLLKLWADMPHCDACEELAAKMDSWGKAGCTARLDEIVADILPRAQAWMKGNKPWLQKILSGTFTERPALRIGIAHKVRQAIELATGN